jgi:hypothetical protein
MAENKSALKESGAQNFLIYALIVFFVAVLLYLFVTLSLVLYVTLVGLSITLAITALVELRFYETKTTLRKIERMLEDQGKEKKA